MAQSYNYKVSLSFDADVGKARSSIESLQASLSKLSYPKGMFPTKEIQSASAAAKELSIHINNAFDASTGRFDLSKLDKSLKSSGKNLQDYGRELLKTGEGGKQAFMELAKAVSLADYPILKINKKLTDFAKTLKDSFKWQLSNTILNSLYGGLQSAYGYAQDLNKSLNNIRIVTQYSTEDMAKFAKQANEAAKSLSTTTTDYTDASLIYYQQGLKESDVINRTNITIKMANATGESVGEVSNQLTAVWNNFYDGSKSLEYYADVMTALGAATASSSDEIAQGLSKFASVAETVGLSYEYATSALATVTAETRESADTVGNAFKTLFARIQGLALGETLDDGVDLNKYSEALAKVGISVLDAKGQMRDMDSILNDMGRKWDTLGKAEQTALAQTVAGVRQYTHLMSLMENWDKFKSNLTTAEGASGALDEQAKIYEESWEAASKRVQAAAEGIFDSLINDEFFIDLNDALAETLSGLDSFIEKMGGIKNIIIGVGGLLLSNLSNEIPVALDNLKYNFEVLTKQPTEIYEEMRKNMTKMTEDAFSKGIFDRDSAEGKLLEQTNQLTAARMRFTQVSEKMTEAEKQMYNMQLSRANGIKEEIYSLRERNKELNKAILKQREELSNTPVSKSALSGLKRSVASLKLQSPEALQAKLAQDEEAKSINLRNLSKKQRAEKKAIRAAYRIQDVKTIDEELKYSKKETYADLISSYQKLGEKSSKKASELIKKFFEGREFLSSKDLEDQLLQLFEKAEAPSAEDLDSLLSKVNKTYEEKLKERKKVLESAVDSYEDFADTLSNTATEIQKDLGQLGDALLASQYDGSLLGISFTEFGTFGIEAERKIDNRAILDQITKLSSKENSDLTEDQKSYLLNKVKIDQNTTKSDLDKIIEGLAKANNSENIDINAEIQRLQGLIGYNVGIFRSKYFESLEILLEEAIPSEDGYNINDVKKKVESVKATFNKDFLQSVTKDGQKVSLYDLLNLENIGSEDELSKRLAEIKELLKKGNIEASKADGVIKTLFGKKATPILEQFEELRENSKTIGDLTKEFGDFLDSFKPTHVVRFSEAFGSLTGVLGNTYSMFNNIKSVVESLSDPDLSGWEKMTAVFSGVGIVIPQVMSSLEGVGTITAWANEKALELAGTKKLEALSENFLTKARMANFPLQMKGISLTQRGNLTKMLGIELEEEELEKRWALITSKNLDLATTIKVLLADKAETNAEGQLVIVKNAHAKVQGTINFLTSKFAGLWIAIGAIGIGLMILGIVKALDKMVVTQEEAIQAIDNSNKAYDEQKGKVEEYESELSSVQERMQELQNMGPLNAVESAELNRLKQRNNELQKSLELEKDRLETQKAQRAMTFEDNWRAAYGSEAASANYTTTETPIVETLSPFEMAMRYMLYGENAFIQTTPVVSEKTKADYEKSGITEEQIEAYENLERGYQQYLSDINYDPNTVTNSQQQVINEIQAALRDSRMAQSQGNEDIYYNDFVAPAIQSVMFGKTSEEMGMTVDKNGNYSLSYNEADLVQWGISAEEANNYINTQIKKATEAGFTEDQIKGLSGEELGIFLQNADNLKVGDYERYLAANPKSTLSDWISSKWSDSTNIIVENLKENYKTVKEIINGLKNVGDTISAEEYNLLSDEYKEYFVLQADGTAMLITKASELKDTVDQIETDKIGESIKTEEEKAKEVREGTGIESAEDARNLLIATGESEEKLQKAQNKVSTEIMSPSGDSPEENKHNLKTAQDEEKSAQEEYDKNKEQLNKYLKYIEDTYGKTFDKIFDEEGNIKVDNQGNPQYTDEAYAEAIAFMESQEKEIEDSKLLLAQSAKSIEELQILLDQGLITLDLYKQYAESAQIKEIQGLGLNAEEVFDYAEAIQEASGESEIFSENLKENDIAAREAAKQLTRYNKAVENSEGKFKDWIETLENGDIEKQSKVVSELRQNYADMFDLDPEDFSEGFLKSAENVELMEQAMLGSEDAYNQLQSNLTMDFIKENFGESLEITKDFIDEITSQKIQPGEIIDFNSDLGQKLHSMYQDAYMEAIKGGKSVEEAMEIANDLMQIAGFEPPEVEMEEKEVTITGELPEGWTPQDDGSMTGPDGQPLSGVKWTAVDSGTYTYTQTMLVPKATSFTKSTENLGGKVSTSKSGGGSSKKKVDKTKKSDTVKRYKEIDDKLENIQKTMSETDKIADSLWGKSRFDQMEKSIELLEQENELLEERLEWSRAYLEEDQKALDETMKKAGVSFTFDPETGNITNYTEEMEKLHKELSDAENQANKDNDVSDSEQERIDKIKERIEELKNAIEAYEGTLEEMRSDEEKYLDNQLKIWEQRYALLNEKFELGFSINESEMELLEYYLGKIEDDLYSAVEGFALMNDQANIYTENLNSLEQKYNELLAAYQNNEISQANYKEGLQEIQSEIISNLESLNELKDSMLDYYENTLSLAQEEIATYTDRMEHLNSVLDHYSSIMDILGKEQDYVAKGSILSAQAENARNELDVYIQQYESAMAQVAKWEEEMANTTDPIKLEELRGYWLVAQEQAEEAQDNMLSKTQEWAEAMRTCVENELSGLAKTLEESLTGGTNFDTMLNSMERASSLQEEYLTTTNQIYETNKLMRQAQQEIDKTTNSVAKRRLANFINETKQLQDQTELSQYELDIQQAKYDLLLAEIALEEAQQAKSTVRLQRDSEGNFGYVYTADSGAIADAEQQLADAQNSLYNIGLEGANDYNQKYAETMQQMYDTLTELQTQYLEGAFDSEEEYQTAVENTKQYFYEKLRQYSSLYQVALTTDSRVVADAWSSDFNDMIYKTEEWKTAVNTYSKEASESLREWGNVVSQVLNESGLNTLDQTIGNVTEQSEILRDTLVGEDGVIKEIQDTLIKAIDEASSKIEAILKLIADTVERSEALMGTVNEEYTNEDTPANTPESPKEEAEETNQSSTLAEEQKPDLTKGSFVEVKSGTRWYGDSWGGGGSGTARNGNIKYVNENGSHPYNIDGSGWIKKTDIVGYDTGGYTGDWDGSYGKLAMLHKKELILNESDTKNFLASMEVMERILRILDLQTISSQVGGILTTPAFKNTGNQTIEQHIEIEANFPNATDRLEIEEAFKNMANLASQYANRK